MKSTKAKNAKPTSKVNKASKRTTSKQNRKEVKIHLSHSPRKALLMTDPNPNDHVPPTFHVVGTCGGVGGLLNASLTPVDGGTGFKGTPGNQDGAATSYDFLFSDIPSGTYSVRVTNGDGVTPIIVD
jgi:hypothetical protein